MHINLPNSISLGRIALVPFLAVLLFFDSVVMRWLALSLYVLGCVSDYIDGYLARRQDKISELGRMLDPVADKLMVVTVIFLLVITERIEGINYIPSLIILLREFLVSSMREFLADLRMRMHVSDVAKWKTALQMFALGFLIIGDASPSFIPSVLIGTVGLWVAALLSILSGIDYLRFSLLGIARYESRRRKRNNRKRNMSRLRKKLSLDKQPLNRPMGK